MTLTPFLCSGLLWRRVLPRVCWHCKAHGELAALGLSVRPPRFSARQTTHSSVCDMRLAVNDRQDEPMFIDIATFGPGAEACAEHLCKGRAVAVTGRLVYREWQAKDGSKRSKHQVIGRVSFGGRPDPQPAASSGQPQ